MIRWGISMNAALPILFLSLGLAVSPAQKTQINAVDIVKQEAQIQAQMTLCQVMGESGVTAEQLAEYFMENSGVYPEKALTKGGAADLRSFCEIFIEEAAIEDIRAEVAFAQTMVETGWLGFGGDVKIEQYNFAGLGTTGGGVSGNCFKDVRTGIRAQIQHLKAYASEEKLNQECVDERYDYVVKGSAPYAEWLGQKENPRGLGWATAENYGIGIADMVEKMVE